MRTLTIAILLVLTLAGSPLALAQAPDHWGPLVGNWKLEFLDKDKRPAGTGEFAFHPGPSVGDEGRAGGIVFEPSQAPRYRDYTCTGSLEKNTLSIGCDTYGFTNHMSYVKMQLSADGNTLSGTWSQQAKGPPEGFTRWRRAVPVIETVEVLADGPWGLDYAKIQNEWDQQGALPSLRLRLRGKDLPIWIDTYAAPRIVASIDDPDYRILRESLSVNDRKGRQKLGILEFPVELARGAKPGRKVITLNGTRKEFQVFLGTAVKVVGLRYVELRDGKYVPISGELKHGAVFFVEASFDAPPAEKTHVVKLAWGEGAGVDVKLTASSDAKVFRSEAIRLQAPVKR
jgi:hypothetical protein